MRTEREYAIKIVDYKGKITGLKLPKSKKMSLKLFVDLLRLYERAKRHNFLTKSLFTAMKRLALTLKEKGYVIAILKYPALARHFVELIETPVEEFEEEIVYGKVREHALGKCSVCGVELVYPAYIVYKKNGVEIKRSNSIGIKCLNSVEKSLIDLVEEININEKAIEKFSEGV